MCINFEKTRTGQRTWQWKRSLIQSQSNRQGHHDREGRWVVEYVYLRSRAKVDVSMPEMTEISLACTGPRIARADRPCFNPLEYYLGICVPPKRLIWTTNSPHDLGSSDQALQRAHCVGRARRKLLKADDAVLVGS